MSLASTTARRRFGLVAALLVTTAVSAHAVEHRPVPTVVIYPGDVIRDDMLSEANFPDSVASSAFILDRGSLVGKVARRTLLPGQAIPRGSVAAPRLVSIGSMVKIVFEDGGLTISTYGSALQSGGAGDIVSVRNTESGTTVSGIVQADGTIHVGSS